MTPLSTYRLQMHRGFGFADAQRALPYLQLLGISDIYCSPYLKSERGSMHGYNVVDPTRLNDDLGNDAAYYAFSDDMRARGLRHLLDIVPNHMGIGTGENPWWNDVLENGPSSVYADFFDIDWNPPKSSLQNRVLLPILDAQYGEILERGELTTSRQGGRFFLGYHDHQLPLAPRSLIAPIEAAIARVQLPEENPALQELRSVLTALKNLPDASVTSTDKRVERAREKEIMKRRIAALCEQSTEVSDAIDATLAEWNGQVGQPRSFDKLDTLLQAQNYRLSYWRVAAEEINYRRFFDVNQLAAVRMEDPQVFTAMHAFVWQLIKEGRIQGLRLDHTDGLYDPAEYFRQLRRDNPTSDADERLYIVAEKVLEPGEVLPQSWQIEGTTGYDFIGVTNGLWVDSRAQAAFTSFYKSFTHDEASFDDHVTRGKRVVMRYSLSSEISMLARQLERIAAANRRSRDFTVASLTIVMIETIAAFPVYRTYVCADGSRGPNDNRHIDSAIRLAKRRNPELNASIFDFLRDVLLLRELVGADADERAAHVQFVLRFQQLTPPVMAKGVEDTAFYTYGRLASLNEVGGLPGQFGVSVEKFHAQNHTRREHWPLSMTASSTHDTKRGEDVRARISVLSEMPEAWAAQVAAFAKVAATHKVTIDDTLAPALEDEYLFYQIAVGALPFATDAAAMDAFTPRLVDYLAKASKEAKRNTSWLNPADDYDQALKNFIQSMMADSAFTSALVAFAQQTMRAGAANSLSQTVLKLASPGVADTYQGAEDWHLVLVDPDNRRPVDYAAHYGRLLRLQAAMSDRAALCRDLVARYADGDIKLYVTHAMLQLRREQPALFIDGDYMPIETDEHVIAFSRSEDKRQLICVVPRFSYRLGGDALPIGSVWSDRTLDLHGRGSYRELFSGAQIELNGAMRLAELFAIFPVAILQRI